MTDVVENANWGSASTRSSMSISLAAERRAHLKMGGGGSCFGDHYDSHYKVAKWPGNTDVDYVTGVRWVDDEV